MSIVVVKCPNCEGRSRVGPEAVGALVVCPLCQSAFLAVAEAPPVPPPPSNLPPRPPRAAEPVAPPSLPEPSPQPRRPRAEPVAPPASAPAAEIAEAEHGIGRGLPATVLVGLALLPFLIPLLWVLAPAALGHEPVLSIAAPTALAIAASALCLAVVYTVDWTPTTRVKGVLMLVGLSYFSAVSLYYLKKEMVDRVKRFFGAGAEWKEFRPPNGDFKVLMPGRPFPTKEHPLDGWKLTCHEGTQKTLTGSFVYLAGWTTDPHRRLPDDEWFDLAKTAVVKSAANGEVAKETVIEHKQSPGREWIVELPDGVKVRIVQVFRIGGRVYCLSAEGPKLSPDDDETKAFFASFLVSIPDKKE
ncbi:MAG TPA: hypothetical protein VMZ71_00515 [Gemmataceae bacterium]|nr:hypothetical protein [Gemmataceae bacterium]